MKLLVHSRCTSCTVEVGEWISNFIPHFIMDVNYLFMLELKLNRVSEKGATVSTVWLTSSCWLQMPWCQISAMPSATITPTRLWQQYPMDYITQHTHGIAVIHYSDVIMSTMASQITSVRIVCSTVHSGADQRNHQSSASLAFVRGIYRWPVDSPHKRPAARKMFPFDDGIMINKNKLKGEVQGLPTIVVDSFVVCGFVLSRQ